jgi:hypothetical protein
LRFMVFPNRILHYLSFFEKYLFLSYHDFFKKKLVHFYHCLFFYHLIKIKLIYLILFDVFPSRELFFLIF